MSVLQTGVYANSNTPLWLSALTPVVAPANIQLSTMTVNPTGGIIMTNNNLAYPNTSGAPVSFNRLSGEASAPTELRMTPSKIVPTKTYESTYLASVTNGGTVYDDLAVNGLQIYGNQVTNPAGNRGCAGYISGGRLAAPAFSMRINTGYLEVDRISSFIINADIGEFNDDLFATNAVFSTLTVSTGTAIGNNPVFSTIKAQSGDISTFTALTVAAPLINTQILNSSTINSQIGNFSTITVSSFTLPQALTISSLNASTMNTSLLTASTLAVSSFTLPNVLTISSLNASTMNSAVGVFSTINASTINTGVISSLVGNFSTIIAPGGTTTPIVSSIITVAKEIFTSTMTFRTTLSPQVDLGLGGIIGGLVGGVTANAMGVGLGAAGLATGATSLILARQSGGLNPGQFQTVNGTTQLQFSTITAANPGIPLYGKFLGTDSSDPLHTPGALSTSSNFLGYGQSFVARSVSDPLNLPNAGGAAGQAIQSFGEWTKVLPGTMDMGVSTIFNQYSECYIDFGKTSYSTAEPKMTLGNFTYPEAGYLVEVKGQFSVTQGISATDINAAEVIGAPTAYISSIRAFQNPNTQLSTLTIIPGLVTSTINVSTLTAGNSISANRLSITNDLTVGTNITLGSLLTVGTNIYVANNANVTNNVTTSNINLQKINGVPYNPANIGMPTGSLMMWPGGSALAGPTNVPTGYLYCDGSLYSGGDYPSLYAAIGNTWGGTPGVSFRVPDTRGRSAFGSLVDITSGSGYAYQAQVNFTSITVSGTGTAGSTNNGWYVTATTQQVYVGMTFNFSGSVGIRSITKILGRNGQGNGWVTPFTIVWSSPTATTFPVFTDSVANVSAESDSTIAPFIGRTPSQPGSGFNVQMQLGSAGITQAIDQTSPHLHTYNLGDGKAYNVAGAPDLIAANNGRDTSEPQGLYQFTPPGGVGGSGTNTMNNLPPNFAIFYYIKT